MSNGAANGATTGAAQMNEIMQAGLAKAADLLDKEEFDAAAAAADDVLLGARLSVLSKCALLRGRAILGPLMKRLEDEDQKDPTETEFREAWVMFQLALRFVPENEEAREGLKLLSGVVSELPEEEVKFEPNHGEELDVIIVGAGASGVGVGLMLTGLFRLEPDRVLLMERGASVGETFRKWPKEMRFISPSFNSQGWTQSFDLNSVAYGTSPAFTLHAEHPMGNQYADYLEALAETNELNVRTETEVVSIKPFDDGFDMDASSEQKAGFEVKVRPAKGGVATKLRSRFVVWAAGEFQYPRAMTEPLFPGSELCRHNSSVRSWSELTGDDFVVIGGYESGMDAASNLSSCGKRCTVVSSTACWDVSTEDPSTELAPYTSMRIRQACSSKNPPRLLAPLRVTSVQQDDDQYVVKATWGTPVIHEGGERREPVQSAEMVAELAKMNQAEGTEMILRTPQPPLLCAGFAGSVKLGVAKDLFAWGDPAQEQGFEDLPAFDAESARKEAKGMKVAQLREELKTMGQPTEGTKPELIERLVGAHQAEADSEDEQMEEAKGCAEGAPLLNKLDESTTTPGLFLVGPAVRHGDLSFCFVYKFRQRFGIVADAIAKGLGRETAAAVDAARDMNMYLDDFECCKAACGEAC